MIIFFKNPFFQKKKKSKIEAASSFLEIEVLQFLPLQLFNGE